MAVTISNLAAADHFLFFTSEIPSKKQRKASPNLLKNSKKGSYFSFLIEKDTLIIGQKSPELMNVQAIVGTIFCSGLHKNRQLSLSYAALGLFESELLFLHDRGFGMAEKRGVNKKHATK